MFQGLKGKLGGDHAALNGVHAEIFAKSIMKFGLELFHTSNEVSELLLPVFDGKSLARTERFLQLGKDGSDDGGVVVDHGDKVNKSFRGNLGWIYLIKK